MTTTARAIGMGLVALLMVIISFLNAPNPQKNRFQVLILILKLY
jgi:hypothetical protein